MAKTYRPKDSDEFSRDLKNASPNDTIILGEGIYYLDRIIKVKRLNLFGASDDATKTIIRPLEGRAFRCQGGSVFKNFSTQGGGNIIEAEGHGTTIQNFISWRGNIPVKLAGNSHLFEGGLIYEAGRTGIEVNGGFFLIPELSDTPFRLKKEIGLVSTPSQDWDSTRLAAFKHLYYQRNMNCEIRNVVGVRCGFRGGMMYGGFVKAVPCAGGIGLYNNFGIENLNDLWNDFASETEFQIAGNTLVRSRANSIFIEGYVGETAKAKIFENLVYGADRSLFVSAFPEAESFGNIFYFDSFGKVVHGLTGNREQRNVGCITPEGFPSDQLISINPAYYKAHQVAAVEADYDFSSDELYTTIGLNHGPYRVNAATNNYGPYDKIDNVPLIDAPTIQFLENRIPEPYRLPEVVSILRQQPIGSNSGGEVIDPPKVDPPNNGGTDPVVIPPVISDDLPHVVLFSDDNDPDDEGLRSTAILEAVDNYVLRGIIYGCQPNEADNNPELNFSSKHGAAFLDEKDNLGFDYSILWGKAETYQSKFDDYPQVKWGNDKMINFSPYISLDGYSKENPLILANGAILTEIAYHVKHWIENGEDLDKFIIHSHFTAKSTDNNYRRDPEAAKYLKDLAKQGKIKFIEFDRAGADLIDDRNAATGEMSPEVLKSEIGQYIGEKWIEKSLSQPGRPDFSDFAVLVPFVLPEFAGFLDEAKTDGTSNLELFKKYWTKDSKKNLYRLIEERARWAINGRPGNDNGNNDGNDNNLQKRIDFLEEKLSNINSVYQKFVKDRENVTLGL